jgi:hypothetical protein
MFSLQQITLPTIIISIIIFVSICLIIYKTDYDKKWYGLIPFLQLFVLTKIINKPWWWVILFFIPWFGLFWIIWVSNLLRKYFNKKSWFFTIGLVFFPFIFFPILAFDKSIYKKPIKK